MKPNNRVKIIMAFVVAAAFVAAIIIGMVIYANNNTEQEQELKPAAFNIAMIGPITSDASYIGTGVQRGAELAIEEINAKGGANGVPLTLQIADDGGSSTKALEEYKRLEKSNIVALIGPLTNVSALQISVELKDDGLLRLLPTVSAPEAVKGENVYRLCMTDAAQGEALAKILKQDGILRAAVLYDKSVEYSSSIDEAFVERYKELGGYVINEAYSKGDTQYSNQLKRIKDSNVQALVLPDYYTDVEQIAKQAAAIGLNVQLYGTDSWYGIVEQVNGKTQNIEGAKFITSIVAADSENDLVSAFVASYRAKYGADPDNYAAMGYDSVYTLASAIGEAKGTYSRRDILKAMQGLTYQGVSGSYSFDKSGEPVVTPKLAGIQNGAYVPMN